MNLNHPDFLNNHDNFKLPPNSNDMKFVASTNDRATSSQTTSSDKSPGGDHVHGNDGLKGSNGGNHLHANDPLSGKHSSTTTNAKYSQDLPQPSHFQPFNHDNHPPPFNNLLFNKLSSLEKSPTSKDITSGTTNLNQLPLTSPLVNPFSPPLSYSNGHHLDSFNLPIELQGGIGNISSRRPSYAAESFTRDQFFHPFQYQNQPQGFPGPQGHKQDHQPGQPPFNASKFSQGPGSFSQGSGQPSGPMSGPITGQYGQSSISGLSDLNQLNDKLNLFQYATSNNYLNNFNQFTDNFQKLNLNANFNDFQSRRPSQLVDFNHSNHTYDIPNIDINNPIPNANLNTNTNTNSNANTNNHVEYKSPAGHNNNNHTNNSSHNRPSSDGEELKLENGLIFKNHVIMSSPELKTIFNKTTNYFQNTTLTDEILVKLDALLKNPVIQKLITFIKNLNNLNFNHKVLCLVINKNGKFDLLSYPNNSNLFLSVNDLVIVDGDRGKDLVMVCRPIIDLNFAILFNFLKKLEHLKSLNIDDNHNHNGHGNNGNYNNNSGNNTNINASMIINNSNQDNEFLISLPTKQVLRFATPKEVNKISGKFLEEKKAFLTCYNKIQELNLGSNLKLINVEYQSDFKKLIFYYYANFKRIDFRSLIKELFKIYKTRIWLCAILPYDNPSSINNFKNLKPLENSIPLEYNLNNEEILNFSIDQLNDLNYSNYFHSINLNNLINILTSDLDNYFYGFNNNYKTKNN